MGSVDVALRVATQADAPALLESTRAAFAARRPLDPPAEALSDDLSAVRAALAPPDFGVIAEVGGAIAGSLLVRRAGEPPAQATLRRVNVASGFRGSGIASLMVRQTLLRLADAGVRRVCVTAREELPELVAWWRSRGFAASATTREGVILCLDTPRPIQVPTADDMRALGAVLATRLRPGDLLVADGELGAGKTTLAQGLAAGLGVERPILSPTFVLARVHPSRGAGPALVHVDAYRLGSAAELDDMDLDATAEDAVTFVEWGAGFVEQLSPERLDVIITRSPDPDESTRTVYLLGVGPRWAQTGLDRLADEVAHRDDDEEHAS